MKFEKRKKRILRFLVNIATSGKYMTGRLIRRREFGMSDYLIRYVLLNFISVTGGGILLGFIIVRLREGKYGTVIACSLMLVVAVLTIVFSRMKKVKQIVPAMLLMGFYGLLCLTVTWLGEANGMNFLFVYMYPCITIMLVGMKFGIFLSTLLLVLVSLEMFIPGWSRFSYPATVPIHMIVTYFLVFSVMVTIELTRQTKDRLIAIQTKKLHELKEEAEVANRTKSNFLASMSHEIRTPMNAITGMAELLLRGELPDESREYVQDIKHAASNLISIINDILDFSKIEAGKLDIVNGKYLLSSMINDTISIIRMRLMEKPVRFYTNIDGSIPNGLIGDEVRIRQIFLNLLSNAVKFTNKGNISVSITADRNEEADVWLKITVADTGPGIKEEDQAKLFGDFVQLNTKRNRNVEGTGLGLAISKRLCEIMGGSITFKSEFGKGSAFTITIPQSVYIDKPFAEVENAADKKVLVYEGRSVYAQSVCWSLTNLKVAHTLVENNESFAEALFREEWTFVFSGYGLYNKIKPLMEKPDEKFTNGKKPSLALMVEWGTEAHIANVRFLSLPVQSLSIADILNGKLESKIYYESSQGYSIVRFAVPNARILVVDDIPTNLKVAEGLLSPYQAEVDTCLNGRDAIELVKKRKYDLVFMDHMMPEIDGIEATQTIRSWEKEAGQKTAVPIIALTANVVAGMREMFLVKGFSDFIAKPIDISKLDEILAHWIPKEKRERVPVMNNNEKHTNYPQTLIPHIRGVDTKQGIAMTGGTVPGYLQVLAMFSNDAKERLPLIQAVPDNKTLDTFITQVHAIKSASASLGAEGLSVEAARLEAAGKAGDLDFLKENLGAFTEHLTGLINEIQIWNIPEDENKLPDAKKEASGSLNQTALPQIRELTAALESRNIDRIDQLLDELSNKAPDYKSREAIEKISDLVLIAEFDSALEIARELK